jgi:hypothetical protein
MTRFYCGLDLGQQQDYTALAVAERLEVGTGERVADPDTVLGETTAVHYHVRHLERLPLGTSYPEVVKRVQALVTQPPLVGDVALAVDATGVGLPVVDWLRTAALGETALFPVLITAGAHEHHERGAYHVPKGVLVARLQVLLQTERLKIAAALPEAATLTRELLNFKVKVTLAAHETYEAWREGIHDDLVLAAALAVWLGEREGGGLHIWWA